jgi:transposase InsO family protein
MSGHPGREGTVGILSRDFYWPMMQQFVRRFLANCDVCGRTKAWRDHKRGFLKPLPIPDRFHTDLSMDFITDLPASGERQARYLWVITDRLAKQVTLEAMESMDAELCAERFLTAHFRFHGIPSSIVSDRGSNWTSRFWTRFCELTSIKQRLSTAYHPQTDGSTERINQEVEAFLRVYINHLQSDWAHWLPAAMLAINNRVNTSIGMSPFFALHGYHAAPIALEYAPSAPSSPEARAEVFLERLREITALAQSSMAAAQQKQEQYANQRRGPAERFLLGDKVWLEWRNFSTNRPKKKLDWRRGKYTVSRVVDTHTVELKGLPSNVHPRFHVDLLRRARTDPLPGQVTHDAQPPPILVEGEQEYEVEEIRSAKTQRIGRGARRMVLVKWRGYADPTWHPLRDFEDTEALDRFEEQYGSALENEGMPQKSAKQRKTARAQNKDETLQRSTLRRRSARREHT